MHPEYLQAARQMGAAIAQRGMLLIYGAGSTGLMGAVADGALEVVDNMHVRKARLAELADAFIALPGGYGTFEELFEMLT